MSSSQQSQRNSSHHCHPPSQVLLWLRALPEKCGWKWPGKNKGKQWVVGNEGKLQINHGEKTRKTMNHTQEITTIRNFRLRSSGQECMFDGNRPQFILMARRNVHRYRSCSTNCWHASFWMGSGYTAVHFSDGDSTTLLLRVFLLLMVNH